MTFPGYPLSTTFTNNSPVKDVHPAAHNEERGAANDLQDQIDALNIPLEGNGSPEGAVSAPVGSLYSRLDGGTNTAVYRKETGAAGNTGWVAITDGGVGGDATTLDGETKAQLRVRSSQTGQMSADFLDDGTTNKAYTADEKTKLANIAINATANLPDADLANLANVREVAARPAGAKVETVSRIHFAGWGATAALTSQTLQMCFVPLTAGVTYSTAVFRSGSTAMAGGTFQNAGLYDSALELLVGSTIQTAATWSGSSLFTFTFTAPFVATYTGLHYLGIVVQASTPPTLSTASGVQGAMAMAPVLHGTSTTGIASGVLPSTAAAISASSAPFYAYLT